MNLKVSLKLQLSKQRKKILVKYHTFEKATYDEYLICSLALHTLQQHGNEKATIFDRVGRFLKVKREDVRDNVAYQYIEDVTGEGSLNSHFKKIYEDVKNYSQEQLVKIMENSMMPRLKIDGTNCYEYYPDLDVSVFNKKVYQGDLCNYTNLMQILMIHENVIDCSVDVVKEGEKPENYVVKFTNDDLQIQILNQFLPIDEQTFEEALCVDISNVGLYKGKIYDEVDGEGWQLLTSSALNNLVSGRSYFYDEGQHVLIRNDSVRKTILSKVHGLYIYKEAVEYYNDNKPLCNKVIDYLVSSKSLVTFKAKSMLVLLKQVDDLKAKEVVNTMLLSTDDKDIVLYGLQLLQRVGNQGWYTIVYKEFLKCANVHQLNLIYEARPDLGYKIEQLVKIDEALLTKEHLEAVLKYKEDLEAKRQTIRAITGEITTKGLREKAKDLESDEDTKAFSKSCNKLIGHVSANLDDVSLQELDQWLSDAIELKRLGIIIEEKLRKIGN